MIIFLQSVIMASGDVTAREGHLKFNIFVYVKTKQVKVLF